MAWPPAVPLLNDDTFRFEPVPTDDGSFEMFRALHERAMHPSVARTVGWDRDAQAARLRRHWATEGLVWMVRVATGERLGTINLHHTPDGDVLLSQFYLDPTFHHQGIGSQILRAVLHALDAAGLRTRLTVLHGSAAIPLYERHGYVPTGVDAWQQYMARDAQVVAPSVAPVVPPVRVPAVRRGS